MADISLRSGEALLVQSSGLVLELRAGAGWEVRVMRPGALARLAAWWRARRDTTSLDELDARTLKDIGLEALARRVAERGRLEAHWIQFPIV